MNLKEELQKLKEKSNEFANRDYATGYICAISTIEGLVADKFVIEAVEKQIPKKPVLEADGYADGMLVYDIWRCPNCDAAYEVDYDDYDYCPECGQKIDRSEAE